MNRFGQKIRDIREKNGHTLEELANKLNMTWSSLGKYERGERKVSPELLEEIANIYDIPLSYFFGEESELPNELKKVGVKWITFAIEMEEKNLTPEQIKATLELIANINNGKK